MRFPALLIVVLLSYVPATAARSTELPAEEVLRRAFAHRYEYDLTQDVTLIQRDRFGDERTIRLEIAQKTIQSRLHGLVRFTYPGSLRGTRVLSVEADGRSDDHFLFLKSQQRVRRVRSTRRDSFMGTDFTMEDMEKREAGDYRVESLQRGHYAGEPVFLITAEPTYESGYSHVDYVISSDDFFMLAARFYRSDPSGPFKELVVPRATAQKFGDVLIGTHAYVRNVRLQTETHIYLTNIQVSPQLPDSIFTVKSLEVDRDLTH